MAVALPLALAVQEPPGQPSNATNKMPMPGWINVRNFGSLSTKMY